MLLSCILEVINTHVRSILYSTGKLGTVQLKRNCIFSVHSFLYTQNIKHKLRISSSKKIKKGHLSLL